MGQNLCPLYREYPLYGVSVLERFHCIYIYIPGVPKKMTRLYNVISTKILNLRSSNFLQWFSMGWNSVLKNLMWLPHTIEILLIFENQLILSPVIIPKITGKIVLHIREFKRICWQDVMVFMQKLVSTRREKEHQLHDRFINLINLFNIVT